MWTAEIVFEAPAECPALSVLRDRVQQSSPRVNVVARAPGSTDGWTLTLAQNAAVYVGLLRSGAGERREISDVSCNALVSAFAYVIAFSLDPDARPPSSLSAEDQGPGGQAKVPSVDPTLHPLPASRLEGVAALRLEMRGMGALGPMFGWGAVLALSSQPTPKGLEERGLLYPSVRLGFSRSFGQGLNVASAQAPSANLFTEWTLGDLEVCPVRFGPKAFAFRPCGRGALGALLVEGRSVPGASSQTRWYGEIGAVARVEGHVGAFAWGVDAGVLVPLTRDEFLFLPSTLVYQIPSVLPLAALWAGGRFD